MKSKICLAFALAFPLTLAAQQQPAPAASVPKAPAAGNEAPTRADILRLFSAMRLREQMEGIQKMMLAQVPQMIEKTEDENLKTLAPEQRQRVQELATSSMQDANKMYPVSEMLNDLVPVYQRNLTKADVRSITAFYLSPSGKKLLDKGPQMMQDAMAVIGPKMQQRMLKSLEEDKKKADQVIDTPEKQPPQDQH